MGRSDRIRGPPKDPYTTDFIGKHWAKTHEHKSSSEKKARAITVTLGEFQAMDVNDLRPENQSITSNDSDEDNLTGYGEVNACVAALTKENQELKQQVEQLLQQSKNPNSEQKIISGTPPTKKMTEARGECAGTEHVNTADVAKPLQQNETGPVPLTNQNNGTATWTEDTFPQLPCNSKPLASTQIRKTYAEIMEPKADFMERATLKYIPPATINGIKGVEYSKEEVESETNQWQNSIIAYVLGAKPPFHVMKGFLERIWRKFGSFKLSLLKSGVYILRFDDKTVQERIIEQGPWTFDNRPLIVKPWLPNVSLEKEGVSSIPLWIRLPYLPLHLWSTELLSRIASSVGKPLFTDKMTATKERLTYARLCVEVSIEDTMPEKVPIRGPEGDTIEQTIEYDWKPTICSHCQVFGHTVERCFYKPCPKQKWRVKTQNDGNLGTQHENLNADKQLTCQVFTPQIEQTQLPKNTPIEVSNPFDLIAPESETVEEQDSNIHSSFTRIELKVV
ncbi:hypothetical protein RJ640_015330 [Escallonia rubra]|uniref:DUF4283 domain-containing protein n=1 Tax=Escallonia rubra TaxID=112253 RepID=A0AA88RYU9_9ASTE|nr:hypothetical protein RJ640_015330 [Escallonia rubra]